MPRCERCFKETRITIMSWLNTQTICMDCAEAEKKHPRFKEAKAAEEAAVKSGNYNYPGLLG